VDVDLFAEDLLSGDRKPCMRGCFALRALDVDNKPAVVLISQTMDPLHASHRDRATRHSSAEISACAESASNRSA